MFYTIILKFKVEGKPNEKRLTVKNETYDRIVNHAKEELKFSYGITDEEIEVVREQLF